jgi:hypothetical protein
MENLKPSEPLWMLYERYGLNKTLRGIKAPYLNIDYAIIVLKGGDSLAIMLKEEQIMNFNDEQQVSIMEWVQKLRSAIELHGIKCDIVGRKAK